MATGDVIITMTPMQYAEYVSAQNKIARMRSALVALRRHNPLRNDQDAYMLEWCDYGQGRRMAPPNPKDFGMPEEPEPEDDVET